MRQTPAAPAPRSRRERPTKPALTRDGIISTALAILRTDGLEKVTMRRVAAALDTGPASLYVYVRDTEDLHAQLLDELLGSVPPVVPADGDWRNHLAAALTNYLRVLFDHPGIARITLFTRPSGRHYLALLDLILSLLNEGGVADRDAAWAVDLLLHFATATAAEQSARKSSPAAEEELAALRAAVLTSDAATYPNIARLGDQLFSGPGPVRFSWGLDVLIDGILARRSGP